MPLKLAVDTSIVDVQNRNDSYLSDTYSYRLRISLRNGHIKRAANQPTAGAQRYANAEIGSAWHKSWLSVEKLGLRVRPSIFPNVH